MRCLCLTAVASVLVVCLSNCSTSGISATAAYNPGYGPFDRNGNYVEAWADKPAQKHRWGSTPAAAPERTPARETPVLASASPRSAPAAPTRIASAPAPSLPRTIPSVPVSAPRPVASPPTPSSRPPVIAATTSRPPAASPPPPKPKPKPTATTVAAKPKPKPTAPPSVRHTVVKGDTLYSLSRRYGASVSAIQSANGISGTNIRPGQSLKIPK